MKENFGVLLKSNRLEDGKHPQRPRVHLDIAIGRFNVLERLEHTVTEISIYYLLEMSHFRGTR